MGFSTRSEELCEHSRCHGIVTWQCQCKGPGPPCNPVCWSCTVHNTFVVLCPVSAHHSTSASAPHPLPLPDSDKFNSARVCRQSDCDCGLSFQGQMRPAAVLFCHREMGFIIECGVLHIYWAIVFVLISPGSHYMCSGLQGFGPFLAAHRFC